MPTDNVACDRRFAIDSSAPTRSSHSILTPRLRDADDDPTPLRDSPRQRSSRRIEHVRRSDRSSARAHGTGRDNPSQQPRKLRALNAAIRQREARCNPNQSGAIMYRRIGRSVFLAVRHSPCCSLPASLDRLTRSVIRPTDRTGVPCLPRELAGAHTVRALLQSRPATRSARRSGRRRGSSTTSRWR